MALSAPTRTGRLLAAIQALVDETAPTAVASPYRLFVPFADNVRGVQSSSDGILLLDKAWTTT